MPRCFLRLHLVSCMYSLNTARLYTQMYRITKMGMVYMNPTISYTTSFLWCGTQCLNPHERTCRILHPQADGSVKIEMLPYPNVLDRIDSKEEVFVNKFADGSFSENNDLFTPVWPQPSSPSKLKTTTGSTSSPQPAPRSRPSRPQPSRA